MVTTLTAERLAAMQDDEEAFVLVDTRPEDSFESWHVRDALNFPFGPDEDLDGELDDLRETVGDADRLVAICAKGISSSNLATQVEDATDEWELLAVEGGMEAWSRVYDRVDVDVGSVGGAGDAGAGASIVQVQRRAKGCLGYVVGCAATDEAVVVDPTRDVAEFELAAQERGLTITGVIDTHVHADHISGGRRLAEALDVPYYLGEQAAERDLEFDFEPLGRNEVLAVGDLEVKAIETPGHTSESISLLVDDVALLTADTLHVDATGRTELEFGEEGGEEGARMLYQSLHRTLLAEPDGIVVLPGHVTVTPEGEFAHGAPGDVVSTTVRAARTGIDALQVDEEGFVEQLADSGEKPANYEDVIEINRGVRDVADEERVDLEMGPNNCSA